MYLQIALRTMSIVSEHNKDALRSQEHASGMFVLLRMEAAEKFIDR